MVVAGKSNDFHVYSPAYMTWFDLSSHAHGTPPTARAGHGFTSAGGLLYVHGGSSSLFQVSDGAAYLSLSLSGCTERER